MDGKISTIKALKLTAKEKKAVFSYESFSMNKFSEKNFAFVFSEHPFSLSLSVPRAQKAQTKRNFRHSDTMSMRFRVEKDEMEM